MALGKDKIGAAEYDIDVDLKGYFGDLKKAERQTTRSTGVMQSRFDRVTTSAKGMAAGLRSTVTAATVAAGGIALLVKNALNAAEGIADMAKRANTTAEALQVLRYAVNQNGGEFRDADDALVRLNRRMSLFVTTGGGPGALAFKALGINARDSAGNIRDTFSVFVEIADKISRMKDASAAAAIASAAFGEDAGPRLVPLLMQGADGMRGYEDRARKLGLVLGNEAVDGAAAANAELRALGQAIQTQLTGAIIQATPQIRSMTAAITDALPELIKWGDRLATVAGYLDYIRKLNPLNIMAGGLLDAFTNDGTKPMPGGQGAAAAAAAAAGAAVTAPPGSTFKVPPGSTGGGGGGSESDAEKAAKAYRDAAAELEKLNDERRFEASLIGKTRLEIEEARAEREAELAEIDLLTKAMDAKNLVSDREVEANEKLIEDTKRLTIARARDEEAARRQEDAQRAHAERLREVSNDVQDFTRAMIGAISSGRSWQEVIFEIVAALVQMESVQKSAGSFLMSLFGIGASAAGGAIAGAAGGVSSGIGGAFADGGSPPVGKFSIVGENGPELRYFGRASTILSNSQSQDLMGGGITQNVIFEGVNGATRAYIDQALARTKAEIIKAVPSVASQGFAQRPSLRG